MSITNKMIEKNSEVRMIFDIPPDPLEQKIKEIDDLKAHAVKVLADVLSMPNKYIYLKGTKKEVAQRLLGWEDK